MSDSNNLGNKEIIKRGRGRPKGSLSGPTRELFLKCEQQGIDVFVEILKLCRHEDVDKRLHALGLACKHLYPTLKAVEISGDVNVNHEEKIKAVEHLKALDAEGSLIIEPSSTNS